EIISSKSCENVYRFNTFLDCAGMLTLRHGNRCLVEGNFFLGHHKHGAGGIRVIGEDHKIINNYFEAVDQGGFWVTSGIPASPMKEHPGIAQIDPRLERASDGLLRPASDSPVKGAAQGNFYAVAKDIDGQERKGWFDVGCDQISKARVTNRPLTAVDVGP